LAALLRLLIAVAFATALLAFPAGAMASNTSRDAAQATLTNPVGKVSAASFQTLGQRTCDCDRDGCGRAAGCHGSYCGLAGCCASGALIGAPPVLPPAPIHGRAAMSADDISVGIGAETPLEPPRTAG
jgi:hypothetical protein